MWILRKRLERTSAKGIALDVARGRKEDYRGLDLRFFRQKLANLVNEIRVKGRRKGRRALKGSYSYARKQNIKTYR